MKTINTCWIYIQPRKFIITTIKYTTSRKDNTLENFGEINSLSPIASHSQISKSISLSLTLYLSLSLRIITLSQNSLITLLNSLSLSQISKKKKKKSSISHSQNSLSLSLSLSLKEIFFILSQRVNFSLSQRNYVSNQYWNWSCPTSKMEIWHHQFWRGARQGNTKKASSSKLYSLPFVENLLLRTYSFFFFFFSWELLFFHFFVSICLFK